MIIIQFATWFHFRLKNKQTNYFLLSTQIKRNKSLNIEVVESTGVLIREFDRFARNSANTVRMQIFVHQRQRDYVILQFALPLAAATLFGTRYDSNFASAACAATCPCFAFASATGIIEINWHNELACAFSRDAYTYIHAAL